jgi:hypothetical protein
MSCTDELCVFRHCTALVCTVLHLSVLYYVALRCSAHHAHFVDTYADTHTSYTDAPVLQHSCDPPVHGFIQVMGTISCKKNDAFMPLYLSEETGGEGGQEE